MAINWPSSPSLLQLYPALVTAGDPQWQWNGSGWQRVMNLGQVVSVFYVFVTVEEEVSAFPDIVPAPFETFTYV